MRRLENRIRLEDRIRLLCRGAVAAKGDAYKPIVAELIAVLRAHSEHTREKHDQICLVTNTETACE